MRIPSKLRYVHLPLYWEIVNDGFRRSTQGCFSGRMINLDALLLRAWSRWAPTISVFPSGGIQCTSLWRYCTIYSTDPCSTSAGESRRDSWFAAKLTLQQGQRRVSSLRLLSRWDHLRFLFRPSRVPRTRRDREDRSCAERIWLCPAIASCPTSLTSPTCGQHSEWIWRLDDFWWTCQCPSPS